MTREEERAIEHDCTRLIAAYANASDAGDWPAVANLFTVEGRLARPIAPEQWITGREAILVALRVRAARTTRHLCTNIVIQAIDAGSARGESAMALFLSDDKVKVGSFLDRFVRTTDGWRFLERRGRLTF